MILEAMHIDQVKTIAIKRGEVTLDRNLIGYQVAEIREGLAEIGPGSGFGSRSLALHDTVCHEMRPLVKLYRGYSES